jgi:hypothetical protein
MNEMENVRMAFRVQEHSTHTPEGYKEIPLTMIFDIKMNFTKKARLVAGGASSHAGSAYITYLLVRGIT